MLPLLLLYGALLVLVLARRARRTQELPDLHRDAIGLAASFLDQYPMHPYPAIAKSLELAFLRRHLPASDPGAPPTGPVVELAVGEGSFSERIFPPGAQVTAFELNPYSLVHTMDLPHIRDRIVADALDPPVAPSTAAYVVCNNLLHHVSDKERTLSAWSRIGERCVTNENTTAWAASWMLPGLLSRLGMGRAARSTAARIEARTLQSLRTLPDLQGLVRTDFEVEAEVHYFHERTFFLAAVCSALLVCKGPPTPALPKAILNGPLRLLAHRLARRLVETLIAYDGTLPRDRDAFVSWRLRSRHVDRLTDGPLLACPDCRSALSGTRCVPCDQEIPSVDGMLFLLPRRMREEVLGGYRGPSAALGRQHL